MQGVSKNFYLGSWIAAGSVYFILLLIGWIVSFEEGWGAWYAFSLLGAVPGIYQMVIWLVLLYKAWASIQDGQTPVSPGKAAGFLFIPFYNLCWVFRAVCP